MATSFKRLPRHISPIHYELCLKPDLTSFSFTGSVQIQLKYETEAKDGEKNDLVKLNVNELDVKSVSAKGIPDIKEFKVFKEKELLEVTLSKGLDLGQEFSLAIEFSGTLNDQMRGFYRTKQKDGSTAAACHFEATGARKAFPCWDEPVFRSTFKVKAPSKIKRQNKKNRFIFPQISLTVPKDLTTLSNMPEASREPDAENSALDRITFGVTPKMPSYLTCWTLGKYDHIEGKSDKLNIPVRIFTPTGRSEVRED